MTTDIQVATKEEVKAEEAAGYVPAELAQMTVDKLAVDFLTGVYAKWVASQGAKAAAAAKAKEEVEVKKAELVKAFETFSGNVDKDNAKLAKDKNWAAIAKNEADKEAKQKELDKALAKLNGIKTQHASGDGSLTVAKLDYAALRKTVFQVRFAGKAFAVAHSSMVNSNVVKTGSDNWLIQAVQPVDIVKASDGSKTANGIPTLVGKPMTMVIQPGKQGSLTHSGFTNGVAKFCRENKLVELSDKTAYQPWAIESVVTGAEYDWLVVKE